MRTVAITLLLSATISINLLAQGQFVDITPTANGVIPCRAEGLAVADFNNDGFEDVFVCSPLDANQLWQNLDGSSIVEVAFGQNIAMGAATLSKAVATGDFNNDGWPDLYVANHNILDRLFINNADGTFSDQTIAAGIINLSRPQAVALADVDNDGFLDIYLANFEEPNVLYRNLGDGTFEDFSAQSGALDNGKAMGTLFFDYDRDGDADLYLTHDNNEPNLLYQNDGNGHFTEVGAAAGVATESFAMGVDCGDVDNDGWLDLYITNLYDNILLRNNGDGTFNDISATAGITDPGMGWGTSLFDFDNDGRVDIYAANDYQFSPYPNVLYRNMGDLSFTAVEMDGPVSNQYGSYGTACLDYDLDGMLDLAVANRNNNQQPQLFRNTDRTGHWLTLKLIGNVTNRSAIGALVEIIDENGQLHFDEIIASSGWASQNSNYLHVGLGTATQVQSITIHWPSGLVETLESLAVDNVYTVFEGVETLPGIHFAPLVNTQDALADQINLVAFPNPGTVSHLRLSVAAPGWYQLRIHDTAGRIVQQYDRAYIPTEVVHEWLVCELPTGSPFIASVIDASGRLVASCQILKMK